MSACNKKIKLGRCLAFVVTDACILMRLVARSIVPLRKRYEYSVVTGYGYGMAVYLFIISGFSGFFTTLKYYYCYILCYVHAYLFAVYLY